MRVEVILPSGEAVGTGFFAGIETGPKRSALVLVSNRHLLENATSIRFWMTLANAAGDATRRFVDANISSAGDAAFVHPDPDTDLAAVVVTHLIRQLEQEGDAPFYRFVPESLIPSPKVWGEFDAAEEIVMMGCPWGIHDDVNKIPLARRGAVASYLPLDFAGKPEFVLDVAAFEGSSGSPVFLNSFMKFDRRAKAYRPEARSWLLGIFKSGLEVEVSSTPQEPGAVPHYPLHLGIAIKSMELHGLFEVVRTFAAGGEQP